MDNKNKKVLVLGCSITGISSSKYLKNLGYDVYLSDSGDKKDVKELTDIGINVEFNGHSKEFIEGADFAIVSPGVPLDSWVLAELNKKNIPYMSDIEFCYRNNPQKFLAITGTNGKTTTTMLVNHILSAKYNTKTCGNIGVSPCDYMLDDKIDYLVCEVSSFQMEYSMTFAPHIAVFTNFTPDHIKFHGSLDNYFLAKAKMFKNMGENDFAILNYDDLKLREFANEIKAKVIFFSTSADTDICIKNNSIYYFNEEIIKLSDIKLAGLHNVQNVMSAIAFAKILNLPNDVIIGRIKSFAAPPHRCEFICTNCGIDFYNDSKATNPEASIVALSAFPSKKVCLIAGGRDKNTTLEAFCADVNKYISSVVLIGEATERFEKELANSGFKDIIKANSLEEAVDLSIQKQPDVVLLSPACASFDMFNSFEHRGEVFREYVLSKSKISK